MDVNCAVHHPCTANFQYTKMKKPALKTVLSSTVYLSILFSRLLQYLSVYTLFSWLQSACLFYSICFYLCVSSHLSISICPSVLILLLLSDYSLLSPQFLCLFWCLYFYIFTVCILFSLVVYIPICSQPPTSHV